jgi:hypothetical protein
MQVKALSCEMPWRLGIPLSRFSMNELAYEVIERGTVATISGLTLWRWLDEDEIKPWQFRSWIFLGIRPLKRKPAVSSISIRGSGRESPFLPVIS